MCATSKQAFGELYVSDLINLATSMLMNLVQALLWNVSCWYPEPMILRQDIFAVRMRYDRCINFVIDEATSLRLISDPASTNELTMNPDHMTGIELEVFFLNPGFYEGHTHHVSAVILLDWTGRQPIAMTLGKLQVQWFRYVCMPKTSAFTIPQ